VNGQFDPCAIKELMWLAVEKHQSHIYRSQKFDRAAGYLHLAAQIGKRNVDAFVKQIATHFTQVFTNKAKIEVCKPGLLVFFYPLVFQG